MRLPAILLASALAVASPGAPALAHGASGSASSASLGTGFGDALNGLRARSGRGALREDARLTRAAQSYAEDMARNGYFSHTGRDGSSVFHRAQSAGCRAGRAYAENIAWGQRSAQEAFSGWAASSGHRTNMLGRSYGLYGLGQSGGKWVLVFADRC